MVTRINKVDEKKSGKSKQYLQYNVDLRQRKFRYHSISFFIIYGRFYFNFTMMLVTLSLNKAKCTQENFTSQPCHTVSRITFITQGKGGCAIPFYILLTTQEHRKPDTATILLPVSSNGSGELTHFGLSNQRIDCNTSLHRRRALPRLDLDGS